MTAAIAGMPVRLYRPPNPSGEFAWANFDDLLRAADFPLTAISFWAERWLLIVPSEAGTGLFEAARQQGWRPAKQALFAFRHGACEIFLEGHRHLDKRAFRVAFEEAMLRASITEGNA